MDCSKKDITNSPTVQAYLSVGDRTCSNVFILTIAQPNDSVKFSLSAAMDNDGRLIYVRSVVNQSTMLVDDVSSLYAVYGKKMRLAV